LGIFKNIDQLKDNDLLVWNDLVERELKLTVTHPPANHFEKMILWTEQDKLWKFPIDNEQGMDEEAKVYFTEHIFLEQHLEAWCPTKGPIRHFMELVCVGLSKNYHCSAQEKLDHINWFKEYFEGKKEILASVIQESKTIAAPATA
jgi:small subunit ribosomal protein S31